jgi:hypothetical protein
LGPFPKQLQAQKAKNPKAFALRVFLCFRYCDKLTIGASGEPIHVDLLADIFHCGRAHNGWDSKGTHASAPRIGGAW